MAGNCSCLRVICAILQQSSAEIGFRHQRIYFHQRGRHEREKESEGGGCERQGGRGDGGREGGRKITSVEPDER